MQRKKKRNKYRKFAHRKLFIFLLFFTAIFIGIDSRLRPLVIETACYKVQSLVTQEANLAIIEQMEQSPLSYGDLITVSCDEKGEISLLSYNTLEVNRLKSQITASVIERVGNMEQTDIYIPLGNITYIDFLHNKGPKLRFRITPIAYVETDIESEFEHTGINQVSHRIYIVLKVTASALVPSYSTSVDFDTKVCVAQTVIIGKVPYNISDDLYFTQ